MRRKIVAGNWKMNTLPSEGEKLVQDIIALLPELNSSVELVIAPPFTHLHSINSRIDESGAKIGKGAQNCAGELAGAYTGEVSASMLRELGCQYVILGHSERREYYGETSCSLNKKIAIVLNEGMTPIFCVGERLEERESGDYFAVVEAQLKEVLYNLEEAQLRNVIIAYEPVWAIGTGKTATAEQAEEMHLFIRSIIRAKYSDVAEIIPILYGGSCKPSNAAELFGKPNVDGGLIGGAALKAKDFIDIAKSFL